ncbi:hypothetical protein A2572_00240 [Candidatus Collierbacteria bacterium RIFOXYD1_FULL_40_9]|uniref:Uncharacterized protein n=1 Tax=Candidatus Collierbacteria bacterium RIFOXYD1_FULL_40_9 TaxID=1817731 RepID=A0A1F5FV60_9BACT|nr:MAG: hypothetical protein A2572_00240 [Candidatus Collierbacteria bacterium RIFOXYD1_FULL_40_9]
MPVVVIVPLFLASLFLAYTDVLSRPSNNTDAIMLVVIRLVYVLIWVFLGIDLYRYLLPV